MLYNPRNSNDVPNNRQYTNAIYNNNMVYVLICRPPDSKSHFQSIAEQVLSHWQKTLYM